MTLESLGPLMDELCAVLHGRGCTVREISITYAPLMPEDVPDPGSSSVRKASSSRVASAGTLPSPRGELGVTTVNGR